MNERIEQLLDQIRVNEHIERLAEQAGCTIDRLGYGEGNLEKFAELIVKECARIAEKEQSYNDRHQIHVNIDQCILIEFGL